MESRLDAALDTLDDVIRDAAVSDLSPLIAALAARVASIAARGLAMQNPASVTVSAAPQGALLTRKEAAARLGVAESWLTRRRGRLPFEVQLGPRTIRYSAPGIDKWIRAKGMRGNKPS